MMQANRSVICLLSLSLALVLFPNVAAAWQCSELTEYVDMWDDSDEGNDSLGLYARGIADSGGDPCGVTVRTYMKGPSGSELTSAYSNGTGHAESQVVVYLDDTSTQGSYTAGTEAWSQGVHYGCATFATVMSSFIDRYYKLRDLQPHIGLYHRCHAGNCQQMKMRWRLAGPLPQHVLMAVVRLDYLWVEVCFSINPQAVASC